MNVSWVLGKLGSALPATAVVAVILFLIREIVDRRRRSNETARKLKAVKLILAQEIERNHWTLKSVFGVLDTFKELFEVNPEAHYYLHVARDGSEHVRYVDDADTGAESGKWIPRFYDEEYKRFLPILAELDESVFEILNHTYSELADLAHYRNHLIAFIADEDESPDPIMFTRPFLSGLADERDDYVGELRAAYKALTGEELKKWRLR